GRTGSGQFFLAMEFIDGPRLSDMLKKGPMHPQELLPLMIQVCMGLRYAHRRGAVHRDLKPSNLLVKRGDDGEQHVKIVDFGLVKLTDDDQTITRTGLILGSPHCMAPEQVRGVEVDHRADIYAIGVLLFRCLTGEYPFHGANSAATMIAHVNEAAPRMRQVAPGLDLPDGLEDVVEICLQKNPANRFQSMADLIDHLAVSMDVSPDAFRSMSQTHSSIRPRVMRPSTSAPMMMSVSAPAPRTPSNGWTWLLIGGALGIPLAVGVVAFVGALALNQGWIQLPDRPSPAVAQTAPSGGVAPIAGGTDAEGDMVEDEAGGAEPVAAEPVRQVAPKPAPTRAKPARRAPRRSAPRAAAVTPPPAPIEPEPPVEAPVVVPEPLPTEAPEPTGEPAATEKPQDADGPPGYLGLPEELTD
ncbi:MAG: serine/threonine-protein kinase, partial [Myxococcota bacterium]